jgi:hypothetical protein
MCLLAQQSPLLLKHRKHLYLVSFRDVAVACNVRVPYHKRSDRLRAAMLVRVLTVNISSGLNCTLHTQPDLHHSKEKLRALDRILVLGRTRRLLSLVLHDAWGVVPPAGCFSGACMYVRRTRNTVNVRGG